MDSILSAEEHEDFKVKAGGVGDCVITMSRLLALTSSLACVIVAGPYEMEKYAALA